MIVEFQCSRALSERAGAFLSLAALKLLFWSLRSARSSGRAIGCRKMCAAFCGEMSDARDENRPFPLRISFFAACGRFWVDYEVSTYTKVRVLLNLSLRARVRRAALLIPIRPAEYA